MDEFCPRGHRPAEFITSDNEQVKSAIEAADEAAALSVPHATAQAATQEEEGVSPAGRGQEPPAINVAVFEGMFKSVFATVIFISLILRTMVLSVKSQEYSICLPSLPSLKFVPDIALILG